MLTETIHFYGGLAQAQYEIHPPPDYDVSKLSASDGHRVIGDCEEIPTEMLEQAADQYTKVAVLAKEAGFDAVYLYMPYRTGFLGRFLSPLTNKRKDKYGARAWITNPEYGRLAYEGRGDDVVPCLRCNACHVSSYYKPWNSVCSVNPIWGLEHKIERMISPQQIRRKSSSAGRRAWKRP